MVPSTFILFTSLVSIATSQTVIYQNNFDDDPIGQYTISNLNADWNTPPFDNGVEEGRASIINDDDAFSGNSLAVEYPAEMHRSANTGAQWQLLFDQSYDELLVEYRVKFDEGFDFVRGGKLPGLIGGTANTGGNRPDGTDGFSARMHWRTDGSSGSPLTTDRANITQYLYHPDQPNATGEDFRWNDSADANWEIFESGRWYHLRHRVVMNTVVDGEGQHDGIVQAWLDGEMVLDLQNIRFRDVTTFAIDGFYFSTFFGGSGDQWNTSKDELAFFDDFIISIPDEQQNTPDDDGEEPVVVLPPGEFVAIQAENFSAALDPNNDGDTYQVISDDDALDGFAITTASGSRTNFPFDPHDALAVYNFALADAGTYTAYYRASGSSGSSNSFFAASDFDTDPDINVTTSNDGTYRWETGAEFTVTQADVGTTLELRIGRREGLNRIDAIILHENGNLTDQELDALFTIEPILLGDTNLDGEVDFFDISPFIVILSGNGYQDQADMDQNGLVDFFDISPFIEVLSSQ